LELIGHRWREAIPWPQSPIERRGASPEINQFDHLDDQPREGQDDDIAGTDSLDQRQELEQTREWAEYLESELHEREEQMQDLEARLARVRQELEEAREADSTGGPTTDEHDDMLTDLFDIRDNFQRAMDAEAALGEAADNDLSKGIELIDSQIRSILEREGVEEIDTSGEVDPTKHRVVKTVPTADAEPGEIVDVYQLGYRLDDRVLREAHVVVAEEPAADDEDDPRDNGGQFKRGGNPT
jgi:molecular chaperone GrpE